MRIYQKTCRNDSPILSSCFEYAEKISRLELVEKNFNLIELLKTRIFSPMFDSYHHILEKHEVVKLQLDISLSDRSIDFLVVFQRKFGMGFLARLLLCENKTKMLHVSYKYLKEIQLTYVKNVSRLLIVSV